MEMVPILRNTKIGEPDAALDQKILMNCFVDSGLLIDLKDTQESASIVLGRTGAGKTAIILKLREDLNYVKNIDPHEISFNFIENSNIIKFLDEIGVNLDLFYRYLWRHILITELLQLRYPNPEKKSAFFDFLIGGKSSQEKEAIKYLTQYGGNFWLETDVRLKEVVELFEKNIKATLGAEISALKNDLEISRANSQEKRSEVVERATKVVNSVQIKELSRVVGYLNDYVFDDDQKNYFLLFDQLDENWTHNNIKYRLVRALIEEIKHLRKIENVKVVVALRVDLFLSVLDATRDSGFQEDKVESLVVRLKWSDEELRNIVEKRISYVYKNKYTKDNICFSDIFPEKTDKRGDAWSYLVTRTLRRPRDILQFINYCFENSVEKTKINWSSIYKAEKAYSNARLSSLFEEWNDIFPSLKYSIDFFKDREEEFRVRDLTEISFEDLLTSIYDHLERNSVDDTVSREIKECWNNLTDMSKQSLVAELVSCFYRVGVVGVCVTDDNKQYEWSFRDRPFISKHEASQVKWLKVHKMFHSSLHIRAKQ